MQSIVLALGKGDDYGTKFQALKAKLKARTAAPAATLAAKPAAMLTATGGFADTLPVAFTNKDLELYSIMFMVGLRLGDKFAQLGEITEEEMDFFLTTLAVTAVYLSVVSNTS